MCPPAGSTQGGVCWPDRWPACQTLWALDPVPASLEQPPAVWPTNNMGLDLTVLEAGEPRAKEVQILGLLRSGLRTQRRLSSTRVLSPCPPPVSSARVLRGQGGQELPGAPEGAPSPCPARSPCTRLLGPPIFSRKILKRM